MTTTVETPSLAAARQKVKTLEAETELLYRTHGEDRSSWPAGVTERFNRLMVGAERAIEEFDALSERGERIEAIRALAAGGGGSMIEGGSGPEAYGASLMQRTDPWAADTRNASEADLRARAVTALGQLPGEMPDSARQYATQLVETDTDTESRMARYIIETSSPQYYRAFSAWFRNPERGHLEWSDADRDAYKRVQQMSRAMSIGTTTAGGFLVPVALDPQILISNVGSVNPMRQVARVETTAQNVSEYVTSAGVTASWDAENTEVSDDSPTLAQPSITAYKGQAFIPVSFELFEDSTIGAQVGMLMADAKAQLESTAFTTGSGSGQPKGTITSLVAGAASVITNAGSTTAVADYIALQNALPPRWRPNAKWMLNLSIMNQARILPMYTNGPALLAEGNNSILGWPVLENSAVDGTIAAGTTHDYVMLAGDFKQYIIVDRIGTSIEFIPNLFGANGRPTGTRGFLMHWRTGGDVVIQDAFRLTDYNG